MQMSSAEGGSKMGRLSFFLSCHLLIVSVAIAKLISGTHAAVSRKDFPPEFVFGAGSSAYQVEGAAAEDGRKPSIWDTFTHAGGVRDKSTADVTADQYHKYKEDVKLMHEMGLQAHRFSVSWSRLIPDGRGAVNPKGLQYYNNLIDELTSYGIEAHVTLNHFDIPQSLQDEYGGYLSPKLINDFTAYADVCFKEFGDRVKKWITFNEPNMLAVAGYDLGWHAPGRCSHPFGNCSNGNSSTEAYIVSHNVLLSHAAAVNLYRDKYQEKQGGSTGITILAFWLEPATNSSKDVATAKRALDFHLGWILQPLTFGNYPKIMKKVVGSRLPVFTRNQTKQLKGSFDFVGLNHYTVMYVQSRPNDVDSKQRDYLLDLGAMPTRPHKHLRKNFLWLKDTWTKPAPWGLKKLLEYIKLNYANPPVFIHENGYGSATSVDLPMAKPFTNEDKDHVDDLVRVNYIKEYIEVMLQSIRNGSNVRGYFVWSFVDCFELSFGYTYRFGLYRVDFQDTERRRYPRQSGRWFSSFLQDGRVVKQKTSHFSVQSE